MLQWEEFNELAMDLLIELSDWQCDNLPTREFHKIIYTIAWNWNHVNYAHAIRCIITLIDDLYMYKPVFYLLRDIAMSEVRLWRKLDSNPVCAWMVCYDEHRFTSIIKRRTAPEEWEMRLNPLFHHVFYDLSDALFDFRQDLE